MTPSVHVGGDRPTTTGRSFHASRGFVAPVSFRFVSAQPDTEVVNPRTTAVINQYSKMRKTSQVHTALLQQNLYSLDELRFDRQARAYWMAALVTVTTSRIERCLTAGTDSAFPSPFSYTITYRFGGKRGACESVMHKTVEWVGTFGFRLSIRVSHLDVKVFVVFYGCGCCCGHQDDDGSSW